jgi:hypothetical protein
MVEWTLSNFDLQELPPDQLLMPTEIEFILTT